MTETPEQTIARFGLGDEDLAAWRRAGLSDDGFPAWLHERIAGRPVGARARRVYGADDIHDFARPLLLGALSLGPGDHLLDVGCGGGILLRDALATGARATGLDHSPEMVALARERAPGADVHAGEAGRLPFADGTFTAVTMLMVLQLIADPVPILTECRRVLARGGRVATYTAAPEMRGTPAAPEPIAALSHLRSDDELVGLATGAGLRDAAVAHRDGGQVLTAVR